MGDGLLTFGHEFGPSDVLCHGYVAGDCVGDVVRVDTAATVAATAAAAANLRERQNVRVGLKIRLLRIKNKITPDRVE